MTGEGRVHDTREEEDVCPTCNHRVEEYEAAVACDGICQRWHHLSCAELQRVQFNALKSTNKRKSKLMWLGTEPKKTPTTGHNRDIQR